VFEWMLFGVKFKHQHDARLLSVSCRKHLALGWAAELSQPMGVVIVGGLLFSQVMTLFITPVVYLWFERLFAGRGASLRARVQAATA